MITDLKLAAAFETSAFILQHQWQPQTGITAVVGPNGSGKSTSTIELVRALLFGQSARRGAAADYKRWDGQGTFLIGGNRYTIKRNAKKEEITDAQGTVLAVGAKEVTKKVEELLGYGLEVFDICNASVQKDGDKIGRMAPSERKRLIDKVVGTTAYENAEKACREEAKGIKREVEALTRQLREPVEPEKPADYVDAAVLEGRLMTERAITRDYEALLARRKEVAEPIAPKHARPALVDIDLLTQHERERERVENERRRLQSFLQNARVFYDGTDADLDAAQNRLNKRNLIDARGPKPTLPVSDVERLESEWAEFDAQKLTERVSCPNCHHTFHPGGEPLPEPSVGKLELRRQRDAHAKWAGQDDVLPEGRDLTQRQIDQYRQALRVNEEHERARAQLDGLPPLDDKSSQLDELRRRWAEHDSYDHAMVNFVQQNSINKEVDALLLKTPKPDKPEALDDLSDQLARARVYESALARYHKDVAEWQKLAEDIKDKQEMAEEFIKGGNALADARATIKAYLAPRLSVVASSILSDMTLGKLSSIIVDGDMNITVNGQRMETLSGGGETVANIALRIAMGQVLVGDVFPVFLGDEIDADTDSVRRQAVIDAMVGLKSHIKQIILVTHRDVSVADHVIELEQK